MRRDTFAVAGDDQATFVVAGMGFGMVSSTLLLS